eukprot:15462897-Alexandrium_andersonii.AAC.1
MAVAATGRAGPAPPMVRSWLQEAGIADPTSPEDWAHCLVAWRTWRCLQHRVQLRRRVKRPTAARDPLAARW